jgi:hypothetical protein
VSLCFSEYSREEIINENEKLGLHAYRENRMSLTLNVATAARINGASAYNVR